SASAAGSCRSLCFFTQVRRVSGFRSSSRAISAIVLLDLSAICTASSRNSGEYLLGGATSSSFPVYKGSYWVPVRKPRGTSLEEFADLRLVQWAHMLGFRGHFSTKSRRYSTTLGALRAARIAYIRQQLPGWQPPDDQDPDLIVAIAEWRFHSQGLTRGEALVTAALTGKPLPPSSQDATTRSAA